MRSVAIGFFVVFLVAGAAYSRLPGNRDSGVFNIGPPTPYFHYTSVPDKRGRILVVHGLDANKGLMNTICYGLADAGFEVFSIDLPGHGNSPAPFNAVLARETVAKVLHELGSDTNVLGHSLGGALLLDVASEVPVGNMVLFSPAPVPLEKVQAPRILLYAGQFDVGRVREFGPQLESAVEGVEYHELAWTGHSGALLRPSIIRQVAEWLGGDSRQIRTSERLVLLLTILISSIGLGVAMLWTRKKPAPAVPFGEIRKIILMYMGAAGVALLILAFVPVTRWLHLFATDYLIGFQFLTGLVLCIGRARISTAARPILIALGAAAYFIVVPGLFPLSEFVQVTLSNGRWLRFPEILVLSLPFFFADEVLLRPIASAWKSTAVVLLTRVVLEAMLVTSTLIWNRDYAFLIFIAHFVVIFWIALWFLGGVVYRRTQDRFATALFVSILEAWFLAAIFVTTG